MQEALPGTLRLHAFRVAPLGLHRRRFQDHGRRAEIHRSHSLCPHFLRSARGEKRSVFGGIIISDASLEHIYGNNTNSI